MTSYFDSSALVPVYVLERYSMQAAAAVRAAGPLLFTALHRLEIENTFRLLVGRGAMTEVQGQTVEARLHGDLEAQRLIPVAIDFDEVFAAALALSRRHAARLLPRSLDLLHVAAARLAGCTRLVSADDRQLTLARAAGLEVLDIKAWAR